MEEYIVNIPDLGELTIEKTNIEEAAKQSKRRLLAYYVAVLAPKIRSKLSNGEKIKLLVKIVGTLDEEEIRNRMMQLNDENKEKKFVSVLQELVDAYEDEDLEQYIDNEINGNIFSCTKDLDISPYLELFESIGNDTQGNRWRVEIDATGKVVLHD